MKRRRFKQTTSLKERLIIEAQRAREEAERTPPGIERDHLLRKARHADTAAHVSDWLKSPGLQPPR